MLFIKTIADSGSNIVFTFNGDGEANSFAVMICQCGASPGPRIIESTTPVLTTVEFSPLAMMCVHCRRCWQFWRLRQSWRFAPGHHYWRHDTVHPMYKRVLAFRYSQSDRYLQRCLSAKNYRLQQPVRVHRSCQCDC